MRALLAFLLALVFAACSEQKPPKAQPEPQEEVSIEANDEKSEVNDTNVPLPVPNSKLFAPSNASYALFLGTHTQGGGE